LYRHIGDYRFGLYLSATVNGTEKENFGIPLPYDITVPNNKPRHVLFGGGCDYESFMISSRTNEESNRAW